MTGCAYFILGIPATLVFVFKYNTGIRGIWGGPTLAVAFLTIAYLLIFERIDWHHLIKQAEEQREKDKQSK